jgi:hypothetical protein
MPDQSWRSLIDALELRARSGGDDAADLAELLQDTSERIKLARLLARPENKQAQMIPPCSTLRRLCAE